MLLLLMHITLAQKKKRISCIYSVNASLTHGMLADLKMSMPNVATNFERSY